MKRIHLVGIGGIGMSAIARLLVAQGYQVSGSDLKASALTAELERSGIIVFPGHAAEHIQGADLVAFSSAVPRDNVELEAARKAGLPILKRGELLARLMEGHFGIAIAGTHGKTTTTALIGHILAHAGLDPTIIAGGIMANFLSNARLGKGRYFVLEADEYDRTFLELKPKVAVITAIEMDHPDCFRDIEDMMAAYRQFASGVQKDGLLVGCGDEPRVQALLEEKNRGAKTINYGFSEGRDWQGEALQLRPAGGHCFAVRKAVLPFGRFHLPIPGRHNVLNALAAIACCDSLGIGKEVIAPALESFQGVGRRLEWKGEAAGVLFIDDYAHLPTQVRATLSTVRELYPGRRLWAVFQPHTYSRTKALLTDFAHAFAPADRVIIADIYAARETNTLGLGPKDLVATIEEPPAQYVGSSCQIVEYLLKHLQPQDILITLNAGDAYLLGEKVQGHLRGDKEHG